MCVAEQFTKEEKTRVKKNGFWIANDANESAKILFRFTICPICVLSDSWKSNKMQFERTQIGQISNQNSIYADGFVVQKQQTILTIECSLFLQPL